MGKMNGGCDFRGGFVLVLIADTVFVQSGIICLESNHYQKNWGIEVNSNIPTCVFKE